MYMWTSATRFSCFIAVFGRTKIAQDRLALSDLLIASKVGRPVDRPPMVFFHRCQVMCMSNFEEIAETTECLRQIFRSET